MKQISEAQADRFTDRMMARGDELEVDSDETSAIMPDGKRHFVRKVDGVWYQGVK